MINFADPSTGHEELHRKVNRIQGEAWEGCVALPTSAQRLTAVVNARPRMKQPADDTAVFEAAFLGGFLDTIESSNVRIPEVYRENLESLRKVTEKLRQLALIKNEVLHGPFQAFTEASGATSFRENLRFLFDSPDKTGWNDAKNDRRCDLIDKEIEGTLLPAERRELEQLQRQMLAYRRKVAPLPLKEAQELHQHLLKMAAKQEG